MKILVTGIKGQLGYDVCKELTARNIPHKGVDYDDFDITNREAVFCAVSDYSAVIHCAAYTAVDKAEDEPDLCRKINEDGTKNLAQACKQTGAKMLYISTDYVFPGTGETAYKPHDPTAPIGVYGKTKLAGEKAVTETLDRFFIIRISWVFGINGNNFVKTMLRLGNERDTLNVVADQIGSPTYTADLAPLLCDMAASEKFGIYHATNEGECSWADFAREIFRQAGLNTKVTPVPSSEYPTKATRPLNSRMDKTCLEEAGFARLPRWEDALSRFLQDLVHVNGGI
ncbi:MAG: dTDP-4-dehydrorhamnose reductase [Defluviitaleaceae bacterium]|nr:dTDP-4-dehydrorhamnose reductase [Defluviitaleaceae bacterium]MCL2263554.1 dTDP-4-dehydrorhamnose reductase [Defluviitaleaceae bacterium]